MHFNLEMERKQKFLLFTITKGFKLTVEHSEQCIFKDEEYSR